MKKLYTEPELELISVKLLADVLGPSQDFSDPEEEVPDETRGFDDGEGDIII